MAFLFPQPRPAPPAVPTIEDPEIARERARQHAARIMGGGRQATNPTGGAGVTTPILGSAAQIAGGGLA